MSGNFFKNDILNGEFIENDIRLSESIREALEEIKHVVKKANHKGREIETRKFIGKINENA